MDKQTHAKLLNWHWKGVTFGIGAAIPLFQCPKGWMGWKRQGWWMARRGFARQCPTPACCSLFQFPPSHWQLFDGYLTSSKVAPGLRRVSKVLASGVTADETRMRPSAPSFSFSFFAYAPLFLSLFDSILLLSSPFFFISA